MGKKWLIFLVVIIDVGMVSCFPLPKHTILSPTTVDSSGFTLVSPKYGLGFKDGEDYVGRVLHSCGLTSLNLY